MHEQRQGQHTVCVWREGQHRYHFGGVTAGGLRSMPGSPYDGHTLAETLEQVAILTDTNKPPATAIVDKLLPWREG